MTREWLGLVELVLVFGAVLGLLMFEMIRHRRLVRRLEQEDAERNPPRD